MGVLGYITDFLKALPAKTSFNKCSKKTLKNSNLSISYYDIYEMSVFLILWLKPLKK